MDTPGPVLPVFIDRDGVVIDVVMWARLLDLPSYKVIVQTQIDHRCAVSTIWTGCDPRENDPPLIFETMVFARGLPMDRLRVGTATEEQAVFAHAEMVALGEMERSLQD